MPETVLIEFIGDSKSGVAAAEKQVAANREVEASGKSASASMAAAGASTSKSLAGSAASMKKVGHGLTKFVSLPLLGIGVAAGKMSLDFQKSMLLISTQAGGTHKEVTRLSKTLLDLTAKGRFAQGPEELSKALFDIESVGYRGSKAMKVLKASSDLATVGQAELESTTSALVGTLRSGIKGAGSMKEAIGTLNATIGAGKLHMEDLNAAIGTGFLGASASLGLSLKGVGAALAELTSQNVPANSAATRLRMTFSLMANPTEKAADALKSIGIGSEDLAKKMRSSGGIVTALELLESHLQGLTKTEQNQLLSKAFGGGKSGGTILQLLNQTGDLAKKQREIVGNTKDINKAIKETNADPAVKLEKDWAKLQSALIKVGDELIPVVIPALQDAASAVTDIAGAFDSLPKGARRWVVELGIAALAFGPILRSLSSVISLAGKATKALGLMEVTQAAGGAGAGGAAAGGGLSAAEGAAGGAAGTGALGGLFKGGGGIKGIGRVIGRTLAGVVAGYFVAELGVKIAEKAGVGDPTEGQGIAKSLFHGFNTDDVAKTEERALKQAKAEASVSHSQKEARQSAGELAAAEKRLEAVRKDHSKSAHDVLAAEARVTDNTFKHRWAVEGLEAAEAAHTRELHKSVAAANLVIAVDERHVARLQQRWHTEEHSQQLAEQVGKATEKLTKDEQRRDDLLSKASGSQKRNLELLTLTQTLGSLEGQAHKLQRLGPWAKPELAHARAEVKETESKLAHFLATSQPKLVTWSETGAHSARHLGGAFTALSGTASEALATLGENVATAMQSLGAAKIPHFELKILSRLGGGGGNVNVNALVNSLPELKKARGGPIFEGAPSGDTVPAMLERGEYVLNRKAVAKVGKGTLDAINFHEAPRFAFGGLVKPTISGAQPLADLGQGAINKVFSAAQHYVNAHRPKGGGGIPSFSGPWVSVMEQIAQAKGWNVGDWRKLINQESGGNPAAVNPSSGAFGLGQFLGSTAKQYAKFGALSHDPAKQIVAMAHYIADRYGNPTAAWAHETSAGWYAAGGPVDLAKHRHRRHRHPAPFPEVNQPVWAILPDRAAPLSEIKQWRAQGIPGFAKGGSAKGPSALELLVSRMKQLAAWGIPYVWGGGHSGFSDHPSGLDCSGALSDALHAAGLLSTPLTSTGFESYGSPGPGKATIFANAGHAFADVLGRFWGTSVGDSGSGGLGFHSKPPASYLAQFTTRHVPEGLLGSGVSGSAFTPSVPEQLTGTYTKGYATVTGHKGKGGIPGIAEVKAKYKVQTSPLSFDSPPESIEGCTRELALRRRQLHEYRAAARDVKDKKTKKALENNAKAIQVQIAKLVKKKAELVRKRNNKRIARKIAARGTFPEIESALGRLEHNFDLGNERAEQLISLEPEEQGVQSNFANIIASYIEGQERPAWESVLGTEASWRNTLLGGELLATERISGLEFSIAKIEALKGKGEGKSKNKAWKAQKWRIPELQAAINAARESSGEWEGQLGSLQGLGGPRGFMGSLPADPQEGLSQGFGGSIFDTELSIKELGLKIKQAEEANKPEENTALIEALKAQAETAQRSQRLAELQYGPFQEFLKGMPPYLGAFKTGGVLPADGMYYGHKNETVIPAGAAGGDTLVNVHLHGDIANVVDARMDAAMPGMVKAVDRHMGTRYRQITFAPGGRKR